MTGRRAAPVGALVVVEVREGRERDVGALVGLEAGRRQLGLAGGHLLKLNQFRCGKASHFRSYL